MRFDYLHATRPVILQRLLEFRIHERFHTALFALAGTFAVVIGAWGIEAYRLREALKIEAVYQVHFDVTQNELKRANVYYGRVRALVNLDRRVREIADSGDVDALTLAEIANQLPAHAWLTGISHDASGMALEGRANNLGAVSSVMQGLMRARHLHHPRLESATIDKEPGADAEIKYDIHVDGAALR